MRIINGEFEVYETGTISSPDMSDTKFIVSEQPLMEIVFRISMDDSKGEGISLEVIGEHTLAIIFSQPSGLSYGLSAPIKVGNVSGKPLYVSFRVSMRGGESTQNSYGLEYTFYTKEAE